MSISTRAHAQSHPAIGGADHLTTAPVHEHGWLTESVHPTSEGPVAYVRCVDCGIRRVDRQGCGQRPPEALSREMGTTA